MHFIGQQQLQFFETVVAVIFLYVYFYGNESLKNS